MKESYGRNLPESGEDFKKLAAEGGLRFHTCVSCLEGFSPDNTQTPVGWRETQISGYCESCWDNIFINEDEAEGN